MAGRCSVADLSGRAEKRQLAARRQPSALAYCFDVVNTMLVTIQFVWHWVSCYCGLIGPEDGGNKILRNLLYSSSQNTHTVTSYKTPVPSIEANKEMEGQSTAPVL